MIGASEVAFASPPQKQFFVVFSENVMFSKKIVIQKISEILLPAKKGYIHFPCQTHPSLQRGLDPPWKQFFAVFSEIRFFSQKESATGNKKEVKHPEVKVKISTLLGP